jgi:hypothetical protein
VKVFENFKYLLPYVSKISKGAIISISPKTEKMRIPYSRIKCATSLISCHDDKGRRFRADVVIGKRSGKVQMFELLKRRAHHSSRYRLAGGK